MPLTETSFEKLGAFYLGRQLDPENRTPSSEPLLYDSRDLVTHAVCVGMTGSGKTGLCLALLEEAAIDGVPVIVIDPKGDLGNLLLTFPNMEPADFRPWINEEDAARKGVSPDDYASAQASLWREGLARWGQSPDRIRRLRESAEMTIYTPGSTSGVPINIFNSFSAPESTDAESIREKAQNAAAGLLSLLGITADPSRSREGILVSTILDTAWQTGEDLDLPALASRIQRPPFDRVGLLDLETFFPEKDRFQLVMALNNVLAAPAFATWREGCPLDMASMLYSREGKPRVAIFSIAHLGDTERMFFVSMLLNEVLAWTRAQSGTTSLRALVYMDEIFGYLPPTANPPSKLPLLTLLKQARAFGVGLVLATQNPVDLDYKALSNAGTWFIGRLQTERDKARMLDGLQGAASSAGFDRASMESLLSSLGNRVFLMNNVHSAGPCLFETRWVMSYLRGPLTRDQIRQLTASSPTSTCHSAPISTLPTSVAPPRQSPGGQRPTLPPGIPEVFAAASPGSTYHPFLMARARVAFRDARLGFEDHRDICLLARIPEPGSFPDWSSATSSGADPSLFSSAPSPEAFFSNVPAAASRPSSYPAWTKAFQAWINHEVTCEVLTSREPRATMEPNESPAEFHARLHHLARESRDAEIEALRKKFAPRRATLEDRLNRARIALQRQKEQAGHARMNAMITIGSSILGAFLGGKAISSRNVSRATTATRDISRTLREQGDIAGATEAVEVAESRLREIEAELESLLAAVASHQPAVESKTLRPARGGISLPDLRLAWIPVPPAEA
ncbi:MAG: ATP-binding protein [Terrimicrobiaceae bacterium]